MNYWRTEFYSFIGSTSEDNSAETRIFKSPETLINLFSFPKNLVSSLYLKTLSSTVDTVLQDGVNDKQKELWSNLKI